MTIDVVEVAQRLLEQRRDALDAMGFSDDLAWDAENEPDIGRRQFASSALFMQKTLEGVIHGNHDPIDLAHIIRETLPAARHSTEFLRQKADAYLKARMID